MTALVFGATFLAYLAALPPALYPWRDTGEMATAVATLGVPHPTSYPLYVLFGRVAAALPLGNPVYRLNLLSAVAGAAACALLFSVLRARRGTAAGLAAAAALALNPTFWAVSQVSEMYSLWILGAVALIAMAVYLGESGDERLWPGFCFFFGLVLANRLDAVLLAPGLVWVALASRPKADGEDGLWAGAALVAAPALAVMTGSNLPFAGLLAATGLLRARGSGAGRRVGLAVLCGLAGFSVYLYLPVRSATAPFLDWNHPAAFANFLDSILRTRYGGTLDLISRSYATGAMFVDSLRLYAGHLWSAFGPLGLAAAAAGMLTSFAAERGRAVGQFAAWWWAGPAFLFLANMPPNAHAAAIVEPHYLLSDAVLLFWLAEGVAAAGARAAWAPAALAAAALAWGAARGGAEKLVKREHFAAPDFAAGALRSVPPGAVLVAKKDVQLYALWQAQAAGRRPDVRVVSQGLAGSDWYRADWRRRDPRLPVGSLREPAGWERLAAAGPLFATPDAEPPAPLQAAASARGLVVALPFAGAKPDAAAADAAREFLFLRGAARRGDAPDFFTGDLLESRALAAYRDGLRLHAQGRMAEAEARLLAAWALNGSFPEAALFLGFVRASGGRFAEAAEAYEASEAEYREKLELAARYRALPEVLSSIRRQAAEACTHLGVSLEKLGRLDAAASAYARALALTPLAQTRYNLAVLAWGKDWGAVEENLSEALRLDPNHADARRYLEQLQKRTQRR